MRTNFQESTWLNVKLNGKYTMLLGCLYKSLNSSTENLNLLNEPIPTVEKNEQGILSHTNNGRFPQSRLDNVDLQMENIIALFKKGDPGNYRPVTLTSVACKLTEKLLRAVVVRHMIINTLFSIKTVWLYFW